MNNPNEFTNQLALVANQLALAVQILNNIVRNASNQQNNENSNQNGNVEQNENGFVEQNENGIVEQNENDIADQFEDEPKDNSIEPQKQDSYDSFEDSSSAEDLSLFFLNQNNNVPRLKMVEAEIAVATPKHIFPKILILKAPDQDSFSVSSDEEDLPEQNNNFTREEKDKDREIGNGSTPIVASPNVAVTGTNNKSVPRKEIRDAAVAGPSNCYDDFGDNLTDWNEEEKPKLEFLNRRNKVSKCISF